MTIRKLAASISSVKVPPKQHYYQERPICSIDSNWTRSGQNGWYILGKFPPHSWVSPIWVRFRWDWSMMCVQLHTFQNLSHPTCNADIRHTQLSPTRRVNHWTQLILANFPRFLHKNPTFSSPWYDDHRIALIVTCIILSSHVNRLDGCIRILVWNPAISRGGRSPP